MKSDNEKIGARIRSIRLSKGWTLEELGERLNTSKVTVFNWEKGRNKPNKENLKKIATLGNRTVDELLYGRSELEPGDTENSSYINNKSMLEKSLDDTLSNLTNEVQQYQNRPKENLTEVQSEELHITEDILAGLKHAKSKYEKVRNKYPLYIFSGVVYVTNFPANLSINDLKIDSSHYDSIQVERRTNKGVEIVLPAEQIIDNQQVIDIINRHHGYNIDIKLNRKLSWESSLNEYEQILNY